VENEGVEKRAEPMTLLKETKQLMKLLQEAKQQMEQKQMIKKKKARSKQTSEIAN
jgi:hypothetical protein